MSRLLLISATAVLAAAAGYFSYAYFMAQSPPWNAQPPVTDLAGRPLVGQPRPDYTLGSLDGSIVSASDFDGRVVLVNFWATWCAPCRDEMPMLMEVREAHRAQGLEIVGIALDDVQRVREFVAELGIEYPNLVGSTDVMATLQRYGNTTGALPYSVLVDRAGVVRWVKHGVLKAGELEREVEALVSDT